MDIVDKQLHKELLDLNDQFDAKVNLITNPSSSFYSYLAAAEMLFLKSFDSFFATIKWVNFEHHSKNKLGMNFENLGI